jgi:hypothetical protein
MERDRPRGWHRGHLRKSTGDGAAELGKVLVHLEWPGNLSEKLPKP